MKQVRIVTDGSCEPNPGIGGWAYIISFGNKKKEVTGYEDPSTNNRMELTAAIEALESLYEPCEVEVISDSQYLVKGAKDWMVSWKKKKWKLRNGNPVLNQDLWERIDSQKKIHKIKWKWVKGHEKHSANNRADKLAEQARIEYTNKKYGKDNS